MVIQAHDFLGFMGAGVKTQGLPPLRILSAKNPRKYWEKHMPGYGTIPTIKVAGQYWSIGRVQIVIGERVVGNVVQSVGDWMLTQQVPGMLVIFKIIVSDYECILFEPG
jgi:hypothetical protein